MEDNSNNSGCRIGCLDIIILVLVILKITGSITMSWWWIVLLVILAIL